MTHLLAAAATELANGFAVVTRLFTSDPVGLGSGRGVRV